MVKVVPLTSIVQKKSTFNFYSFLQKVTSVVCYNKNKKKFKKRINNKYIYIYPLTTCALRAAQRPLKNIRQSNPAAAIKHGKTLYFSLFNVHLTANSCFFVCSSQLKQTNDASKKASNHQLFVCMLGSSI